MNDDINRDKLNLETAQIPWTALQRQFAAGCVLHVADGMDLVDVACQFAGDNKSAVKSWLEQGLIAPVADDQAKTWFDREAVVWAVVVAPWVLVQSEKN